MDKDIQCPYCGEGQDIDHDDGGYGYGEGETYNQECRKCGKTFVYETSISFSYDVRRADCLNGGEHRYERTKTFPPEFARMRCGTCGDEQPLPKISEEVR